MYNTNQTWNVKKGEAIKSIVGHTWLKIVEKIVKWFIYRTSINNLVDRKMNLSPLVWWKEAHMFHHRGRQSPCFHTYGVMVTHFKKNIPSFSFFPHFLLTIYQTYLSPWSFYSSLLDCFTHSFPWAHIREKFTW